jgi:hypothetical protein
MSRIRLFLSMTGFLVLVQPALSQRAQADEKDTCTAHAGTLLTGSVVSGPSFKPGGRRKGVELSHTHVQLRGDDGKTYDVAMDDVFAAGYDKAGEHVPAPLSQIKPGTHLELCGQPYTDGTLGIHWVHTNCGDQPTQAAPDGWVKVIGADGTPGDNLESSQEYCRLWP